jgi:hypothetical protein
MKDHNKGSLTVEAALIMPIVIFIIFAVMYLSFYLHDRCRIQGIVDRTLHKAELTLKHKADFPSGEVKFEDINDRGVFYLFFDNTKNDEENIGAYLQNELKRGLFFIKINSINVTVNKFGIAISVEAKVPISFFGVTNLWKPNYLVLTNASGPIHNPAETIRLSEVVLQTGSKFKGADDLKEKIERVLK